MVYLNSHFEVEQPPFKEEESISLEWSQTEIIIHNLSL